MLKSFKTEINPTQEQKVRINKTIGTCRYVYNLYLNHRMKAFEAGLKPMSGLDFSKWLNNEFIPQNPDKAWIKEVSSKSVKQSIMNCHAAYNRFFAEMKKQSNTKYTKAQIQTGKRLTHYDMQWHPKFKKKHKSDVKMYFVRNDARTVIACERHRIKIPTLGWVRLKEKGYLPTNLTITSGTVSIQAGRYYVSVLVDVDAEIPQDQPSSEGIGVDLGLKEFAVVSDGTVKGNINKTDTVHKLEKKLKREQRKLSKKYRKGEATGQNIRKQVMVVQRLHQRLANIRTDYINKVVSELVKTKPAFIAIEDLNVRGMMKNKHLSRAIAQQKFSEFRTKLANKCAQSNIELRIVDRFFPSSKLCHACGAIKTDLKLSDRVYTCECGYVADRDYNASLNLRDTDG